jgi:virulence-associated protein VapD
MSDDEGCGDLGICRSEFCDRIEIHPAHPVLTPRTPQVHHRPRPGAPLTRRRVAHDPCALTGAVMRATSTRYPRFFREIVRDVLDDYGMCSVRTIHRHINKVVERGHLLRLDFDLTQGSVYLRPKTKLLGTAPWRVDDVLAVRELALDIAAEHGAYR